MRSPLDHLVLLYQWERHVLFVSSLLLGLCIAHTCDYLFGCSLATFPQYISGEDKADSDLQ
jgi:hypothetical protein